MADAELRVRIDDWHGYSAYEIAVQNGYTGTQAEWLQSLIGEGYTVNTKSPDPVSKDITVRATDIARSADDATTVDAALTAISDAVADITAISDADIDDVLET